MKTTYTAKATIKAHIEDTWETISKPGFVKDFLPEIKKTTNELSPYVRNKHRNAKSVQPSYAVLGQAIGWSNVAGTDIHLARKDVNANIDTVDIKLEEHGNNTRVIVEVTYNPRPGNNYLLAHRCIRGLFKIKLNVLKQELETDVNRIQLSPALT